MSSGYSGGRICAANENESHPQNWANQTVWTGDNLPIMRGMNGNSVDLIYLDPPFNSKADYAAPIGSRAAGAEFRDTWTLQDVDVAWLDLIEAKHPALGRVIQASMTGSDKAYLIYMSVRLLEMRRLLKPSGSIYLHCDPTMSHYLKLVMDAIFGRRGFRNEIVWCYRKWAVKGRQFVRNHDIILFYAAGGANTFNVQMVPVGPGTLKRWKGRKQRAVFVDGVRQATATEDAAENPCPDWWDISILNPNAKERVGYPTQKPLALLRRIVEASSDPGDVVFDPFCGCATACIAAEHGGRRWAGIDISPKAAELVVERMGNELGLLFGGINRTDVPKRTDIGRVAVHNCSENRRKLYGEQGGHCNGCRQHFLARNLTVDHIIPRSKGGTDHIENLQLLCGHCNSVKGNRGMEYLVARLAA